MRKVKICQLSAEGSNFYRGNTDLTPLFLSRLMLKMEALVSHMLLAGKGAGPGHIPKKAKYARDKIVRTI